MSDRNQNDYGPANSGRTESTTVYDAPAAQLGEASAQVNDRIFSFRGRLGIIQYSARSILLLLVILVPVLAVVVGVFGDRNLESSLNSPALLPAVAGLFALALAFIIVSAMFFVRRLHDLDMSGWYMLITLIPLIGAVFSLYVLLKPGQTSDNRFGRRPDVKGWERIAGPIGLAILVLLLVAGTVSSVLDFL